MMSYDKTILIIGTYDTKSDELIYLAECILSQGVKVLTMDISVLGDPKGEVDYSKQDVASAAGVTVEQVIATGDENSAMQLMAQGAVALTKKLFAENTFDGMISMGGTMGTDLALDVACALPLGVPKYVISTIAFSSLIPPERLAADIQMILWAGGLYGLNSVCKSSLSQAAGAVTGGVRAVELPQKERPLIGMTSLGKSCLKYMVPLKPALEDRGYEIAIFHATGMGGRAFECMAAEKRFVAVMDFAPQELGNWVHGSPINAGKDRMLNAGSNGIPQIWAPGCMDLVDLPDWLPLPDQFDPDCYHSHNRLLGSAVLNREQRCQSAKVAAERLLHAKAPVHVILPLLGIEEWDRKGGDLHYPEDLKAFMEVLEKNIHKPIEVTKLNAHINDAVFCESVLNIFDRWVEKGIVVPGKQ